MTRVRITVTVEVGGERREFTQLAGLRSGEFEAAKALLQGAKCQALDWLDDKAKVTR